MLHREHPGLILAAAFGAGLWARQAGPAAAAAVLLVSAAAAVLAVTAGSRRSGSPAWGRPIIRAALLALAGLWRGGGGEAATAPPDAVPLPVTVEGTIVEPPVEVVRDRRGGPRASTLLSIATPSGRVLRVASNGHPRGIAGGSRVRISGTLLPARGPRNPGDGPEGGPPFLDVPHPGNIRVLAGGMEMSFDGAVGALRGKVHRILDALYSGRAKGFVLAMLLGDRRLLDPDIKDALLLTGTFHLLAISGLHVVLVMALLLRLPLPARGGTAARLGVLAAFTVLTGASPPVLRAALMFALGALLERAGRRARPVNTLGWTALVLLGVDPSLLHDVGFQLSFVAVLSILTLGQRLGPARDASPRERAARGWAAAGARAFAASLAVSVAASAGTAPITLVHFQRIHPLGPLWNLLAYPLTVVPVMGGFASLVLGAMHPVLGLPAAWIVEQACEWLLLPLRLGAALPGSTLLVPPPPPVVVVLASGALAAPLVAGTWRRSLGASAALLACACAASAFRPREVVLWTLDAGSGDAALLSVPGAGAFLIDAGARGTDADAGANLARAVLALGERSLRGIFITHAHADHLGGLQGLLDRLGADEVWVAPGFEADGTGARAAFLVRERGIPLRAAARGISLRFPEAPGFTMEVLHPAAGERLPLRRSANDSSLALRVTVEGSTVLFLGDIEEAGVARILSSVEDVAAEVLVAPHHGRKNALWPELLERVKPRAVVISGDDGGGARETAARIEAAGISVHATWRGGAVRTRWTRGAGWRPAYWRENP
jgi:competence protein ComEC